MKNKNLVNGAGRRMGLAMGMLLAAGLPLAASAQIAPRESDPMFHEVGHGEGAPFLDARLNAEGLAGPRAVAALTAWRATPRAGARAASLAALRAAVPTVRVDDDQVMGTPQFVRSTEEFLTAPAAGAIGQSARDVVRQFVTQYHGLFEIAPGEIDAAKVTREFVTDHNGVTHLTFQQQIGGVDLFKAEMIANVMPDGRLINVGSTLLARPEGDFAVAAPKITAGEAIRIAAANVGTELGAVPTAAGDAVGPSQRQAWNTPAELRADEKLVTELVYFPITRGEIHPAWTVIVAQKGVGHTYDMVVDALTGEVLYRSNRLCFATTQPITMRVYTSDSPFPGTPGTSTPTGFQFPAVPRQLVTVTPAQMAPFSPNGWIDDGNTETLGNNCDAHLDRDGTPNVADLPRPNGGASRVFDFAQDNATDPLTWSNASIVNLFYLGNKYHDKLMSLGFNEAAGNFQTTNFTGLGTGNDPVQLDCQDGSGTNNANFGTAADGTTGRCQMYLFTGPTPDRDGSLDADIVIHELTHGTSIRLHGGGNLPSPQGGGMGEGWGDFMGLCMNAQAGDDPNAVYCTGAYATLALSAGFVNNYYYGIRRFPYTTDMTKNPLTFNGISLASYPAAQANSLFIGNAASEVHNAGEVWCMSLWEARAAMSVANGFAANDLIMQLVIDGMKLDPRPPNFLQARDSILQADLVNNAGVNRPAIWAAFAKRGMGTNASSPPSNSVVGIVEDFGLTFAFPDGTPTQLLPGVATTFRVNATPTSANITVTANSGQLFYSVNGGAYSSVGMTQTAPGQYTASIPAQPCDAIVNYYVQVGTNSNSVARTSPPSSSLLPYVADVLSTEIVIFADDFEADRGWTNSIVGTGTGTATGTWARAVPNGTVAAPYADHTASGTTCFVTQNGAVGGTAGAADIDNATVHLVSPSFSLAGVPDATIEYWRWYSNSNGAAPGEDTFVVALSSDGGTNYTTVETVGPTGEVFGGWIRHSFRMSSFPAIAKTANMRLRFTASDLLTGSIVEAGVDDVRIVRRTCVEATCVADVDDGSGTGTPDGGVTIDDLLYYLVIFEAGSLSSDVDDGSGTGTHDGGVTIDDLLYYLIRFESGC